MPYEPASTLQDVPKAQRLKVARLLNERRVIGYAFSYQRLHNTLSQFMENEEDIVSAIQSCILAFGEDEEKEAKTKMNDELMAVFEANDIKTLSEPDPFGRVTDYLTYPTSSSSFNQTLAMEMAPQFSIKVKALAELIKAVKEKTKKEYTVFTARDHMEKAGKKTEEAGA